MSLGGFEDWPTFRRHSLGDLSTSASVTSEIGPDELPRRPAVGDQIDRYRLLREIHCGRNSSIFEAVEKRSGRSVALKFLAPDLSIHTGPRNRFRSEVELANRIGHPSILPALHSGEVSSHFFSVLRLENGDTLETICRGGVGQKDEEYFVELALLFASVVEAVALLHESGVVHRDIEPTNILIDREGCFVLTDFGSALDWRSGHQGLDEWIGGTLRYMSPEQVLPGADPFDPAGDVYALGLVLHELLTGLPAFPHCDDEKLARLKLTRRLESPRRINVHVPMGLDAIVRQAIESNRTSRYPSAKVMAQDLRRFVSNRRGSHRRPI